MNENKENDKVCTVYACRSYLNGKCYMHESLKKNNCPKMIHPDSSDIINKDDTHIVITTSFDDILAKMRVLQAKKNTDYGNTYINALDKYGFVIASYVLETKLQRIASITKNGSSKVENEGVEDSLIDLANYAAMTLQWLANKKH